MTATYENDYREGWACWVLFDRGYPDDPTPGFLAGYDAAAHENEHGGGERPRIADWRDHYEASKS